MSSSRYPVLRKTHGSWSGGTRLELLNVRKKGNLAKCRVLAGVHPVIEIPWDDIVWRRRG